MTNNSNKLRLLRHIDNNNSVDGEYIIVYNNQTNIKLQKFYIKTVGKVYFIFACKSAKICFKKKFILKCRRYGISSDWFAQNNVFAGVQRSSDWFVLRMVYQHYML